MHWVLALTLRVCMVLCSAQRFLKRGIALNTRTFNRLLAAQVAGNNIGKMCVHGCGAASVFIASQRLTSVHGRGSQACSHG